MKEIIRSYWVTIIHILLALFIATASHAQPKVLSTNVFLSKSSVLPGGEIRVALQLDIEKGWHINAHKPLETSLIPTEVVLEKDPRFTVKAGNI
jgi:DsbC/DsbD-like thiol-disulfide interchange protein